MSTTQSNSDQSDNADEPMMPAETLRERLKADGRLWKQAHAEGRAEALSEVRRLKGEVRALSVQIIAVEKLVDGGPFLTRWIDGSKLVDRDEIRAALRTKPTATEEN